MSHKTQKTLRIINSLGLIALLSVISALCIIAWGTSKFIKSKPLSTEDIEVSSLAYSYRTARTFTGSYTNTFSTASPVRLSSIEFYIGSPTNGYIALDVVRGRGDYTYTRMSNDVDFATSLLLIPEALWFAPGESYIVRTDINTPIKSIADLIKD